MSGQSSALTSSPRCELLHFSNDAPNFTSIQENVKMLKQCLSFQPFLEIGTRSEVKHAHSWDFDYAVLGVVFDNVCYVAGLVNFVRDNILRGC